MPNLQRVLFALLWYVLLLLVSVNGIYVLSRGEPLSATTLFRVEDFRERSEAIVRGIVGRLETKREVSTNNSDVEATRPGRAIPSRTVGDRQKRTSGWAIPSVSERPGEYERLFRWAAATYGVEKRLIVAVMRAESSGDPRARSHEGALGLMQLMPSTAQRYVAVRATEELYLPVTNVSIGACHLAWLKGRVRDQFPRAQNHRKRRVQLIAAAYNAGLDAVLRHRGIPPFRETRGYVRRVWRWYRRLSTSPSI